MRIVNKHLEFRSKQEFDFLDLTKEVEDFVGQSEVQNGLVNIQTLHTTFTLFLNENEPFLLEDFQKHLGQLAPRTAEYRHNDFTRRTVNMCQDECENGHSHCLALHLPSSLVLNIINGKLQLGQWQRIFAVELDRPRQRKIQLQIMGV